MSVAVRVIPCLDVDNGRVVKGVNFLNLRDAGDPVELAARYDAERCRRDLPGRLGVEGGRGTMLDVVRRTADQVFIPLTVGGGVRSAEDVDQLLRAGADKVSVNTSAIVRPALLRELSDRFGAQCIVLSVDARRVPADGDPQPSGFEVTTHGRVEVRRSRRHRMGEDGRGARCGCRPRTPWTATAPRTASTWS